MKTIIIYNSKSGYTEKYAKIISKSLNCELINIDLMKKINLNDYDLIIFGSRIIAGKIQKLNKIKKIINKNNKQFILFTTGSTPNDAKDVLEKMWQTNLEEQELKTIPHFHMQSGMNIDALPYIEKTMLKMAKRMMQAKKNKTPEDIEFEKAVSNSFDIFNEKYAKDLINYIKNHKKK